MCRWWLPLEHHQLAARQQARRVRGAAVPANTAAPGRRRSPASGSRCRRPGSRICASVMRMHRRQGQARIAAPDEAALDRDHAALDQQPRDRLAQCIGLHPRAHRELEVGEHAQRLPGSARVGGDRVAQARRRCAPALPPARPAPRSRPAASIRCGQAAATRLAMPAPIEWPSSAKRSQPSASAMSSTALHRAGEGIVRARRQVRAGAVAGQVGRDQVDAVAGAPPAAGSWRRCRASRAGPARAARRRRRRAGR